MLHQYHFVRKTRVFSDDNSRNKNEREKKTRHYIHKYRFATLGVIYLWAYLFLTRPLIVHMIVLAAHYHDIGIHIEDLSKQILQLK